MKKPTLLALPTLQGSRHGGPAASLPGGNLIGAGVENDETTKHGMDVSTGIFTSVRDRPRN